MFTKNFYPTPKSVIRKMLPEGMSELNYKSKVLEPSAGKGNIVEYLKDTHHVHNITCIEKNSDLCSILRDKKFTTLNMDFLNYTTHELFDYIIMNPPFEDGDKHLLHAFNIGNGAEIRCLLNEETLVNTCTKERRLLAQIIKDNYGNVVHLGKCFKSSERKTSVDVVLVILKSQRTSTDFSFDFDQVNSERKFTVDDIDNSQVAKADMFDAMEGSFNAAVKTFSELMQKYKQLNFFINTMLPGRDIADLLSKSLNEYTDQERYNMFVSGLRQDSWEALFNRTKLSNFMVKSVREQFLKFRDESGALPYTAVNMQDILTQLMSSKDSIMQGCIEDSFDYLTKYCKENRCHVEGWKTNDAYKVNRKFILPYIVDHYRMRADVVRIDYRSMEKIIDLEKSMCLISGKKWDEIKSVEAAIKELDNDAKFGKWYDSEYFEFKVFKKGTGHFKFKDTYIYEQFNIVACKSKNWLPG